jgi:hypothetical protein
MAAFPRTRLSLILAAVGILATLAAAATAQSKPVTAAKPVQTALAPSDQDIAATQEQLLKLLRTSPTMTTVLAHDPSLLTDQAYVTRSNPELARFLALHPEVAQNPDFYLFSHLQSGRRDWALARAVWPDMVPPQQQRESPFNEMWRDMVPMVFCVALLTAIVWMTRIFVENRRWSRTFKLQSEVHTKLIDKFGSSQELAAYMSTEAGRKFLEAAPIPMGAETVSRMPNALARVLTPLQVGIVLAMLGTGMLLVRHASADTDVPMLVMGTLVLMPGLGFILSAAMTWVLAGRLGLMPAAAQDEAEKPFDARNGQ